MDGEEILRGNFLEEILFWKQTSKQKKKSQADMPCLKIKGYQT